MRAPTPTKLRDAWKEWEEGAEDGSIRNRSGDPYKPSTLRSYRSAMERVVLPRFGPDKLSDLTRADVQHLADQMVGAGQDASTVRNTLMPLRLVLSRAVKRGVLAVNVMADLDLPAVRGRRDRIALPGEAQALIAALPIDDQALWATAVYAGLRGGELMALDWAAVDLAGGTLAVERNWDPKAKRYVAVKSRAGRRRIPVAAFLRDFLVEHKLRTGRSAGLVFGRDGERPFDHSSLRTRAATAWRNAEIPPLACDRDLARQEGRAMPEHGRITLHECRHTFASLMIAAGVNAKALSTYMGHANIAITLDRYGHLMPGSEDEAAALLDLYLTRSDTAARVAQIEG
mgnify:CR=1 FL=1